MHVTVAEQHAEAKQNKTKPLRTIIFYFEYTNEECLSAIPSVDLF